MKEEKHCPKCDRDLPIENFYKRRDRPGYLTYCKICTIEIRREERLRDGIEKYKIPDEPGDYKGIEDMIEDQKNFLELIGWQYSEKTKIWFKPGIKEEDGTWNNIKKQNLAPPTDYSKYSKEELKNIIIDMYENDKLNVKHISKLVGISSTTIYGIINVKSINKKKWK